MIMVKFCLKIAIAALLSGLAGFGCGKSTGEEPAPRYDGWVLRMLDNSDAMAGKIYLQLTLVGDFVLYQQIGELGFKVYRGSYRIDTGSSGEEVFSGLYSDGVAWKQSYRIEGLGSRKLTLTGMTNGEVALFDTVEVPDYVKDEITGSARAGSNDARFL